MSDKHISETATASLASLICLIVARKQRYNISVQYLYTPPARRRLSAVVRWRTKSSRTSWMTMTRTGKKTRMKMPLRPPPNSSAPLSSTHTGPSMVPVGAPPCLLSPHPSSQPSRRRADPRLCVGWSIPTTVTLTAHPRPASRRTWKLLAGP